MAIVIERQICGIRIPFISHEVKRGANIHAPLPEKSTSVFSIVRFGEHRVLLTAIDEQRTPFIIDTTRRKSSQSHVEAKTYRSAEEIKNANITWVRTIGGKVVCKTTVSAF